MAAFRFFLAMIIISIVSVTSIVIFNHGWNLLPIFFGDMAALTWPGQFNADFFGFLLLSGIWVAWRNHFSPAGLALAVLAVFGGIPFLTAYLFIMSFRVDGDLKALILGSGR